MARQPRFSLAGYSQHVVIRGNNKHPIFFEEMDYRYYLKVLKEACVKHECDLHAYVLMTNHVHLLVTPQKDNALSKMMQSVGVRYVAYVNRKYERVGTLWEGRYKSSLIDSDAYALACYRYIELNPVRAKMVENPADYPWSSFAVNAMGQGSDMVLPHEIYLQLSQSVKGCATEYLALFELALGEPVISLIREATNKAWVLGGESFQRGMAEKLGRPVSPSKRGGDHSKRV